LGISAMIYPLFAARGTVWKEIPFTLLAALALCVLANDTALNGASGSTLTRGDGLVLLLFFAVFLVYVFQIVQNMRGTEKEPGLEQARMLPQVFWTILGLILLVAGGNFVVDSAVKIAAGMGISQRLIGLTIVAVGTSLPELATSAVAAYRKNADIAVGNIVGSNIFNIFFILGLSSLVAPLPLAPGMGIDLMVMVAATVLLFIVMFLGRPRHQIQRVEGGVFVLLYAGYVAWLAVQG